MRLKVADIEMVFKVDREKGFLSTTRDRERRTDVDISFVQSQFVRCFIMQIAFHDSNPILQPKQIRYSHVIHLPGLDEIIFNNQTTAEKIRKSVHR